MIPKSKIYKLIVNNIIIAEGSKPEMHKLRKKTPNSFVGITIGKIGDKWYKMNVPIKLKTFGFYKTWVYDDNPENFPILEKYGFKWNKINEKEIREACIMSGIPAKAETDGIVTW